MLLLGENYEAALQSPHTLDTVWFPHLWLVWNICGLHSLPFHSHFIHNSFYDSWIKAGTRNEQWQATFMETFQHYASYLTETVFLVQSESMVSCRLYEILDLQSNWGKAGENSVDEVRLGGRGSNLLAVSRCPLVLVFLGLPLCFCYPEVYFFIRKTESVCYTSKFHVVTLQSLGSWGIRLTRSWVSMLSPGLCQRAPATALLHSIVHCRQGECEWERPVTVCLL